MKPTTAGAARKGGTYLNTAGAEVTISEDQANVAPGYVRVLVNKQAFPVPDSLQLFEREAPAVAPTVDVADLVGKSEADLAARLPELTDEQLDELANEDGRSFVLRLVTDEQDRRSGLGAAPTPAPAPPELAPAPAALGEAEADALPPLIDDVTPAPAPSDMGASDAETPEPALEPEGWEPQRVSCPCCGRAATTEWAVGRATEVLGNHRGTEGGHLCAAVGYPLGLAANLRPPVSSTPDGSATSGATDGDGQASAIDPVAADLGDDTDPPAVEPPTAAELAGPPPDKAPTVERAPVLERPAGPDPWNGQAEPSGKIALIKETSRLDDLDRMAAHARLARIAQEIQRQRHAVEEVVNLAGLLHDDSQPAARRLQAGDELERIAARERTQVSRPGVARLAASYRDAIADLRARLGSAKAQEQAALVRQARAGGPAVETLADYADATTIPPAVTYLHEVMPHGWPAPLVAVLVDLTGGVRACRQALRDLTVAEAATGLSAVEIIEHALALEHRGEARETVLTDLRSAHGRRTRGEAEPPAKPADAELSQAEQEARGQLVLPPLAAPADTGEATETTEPRAVDPEALELARAANPAALKVVPRPDGADLYVRRGAGGVWVFVGPVDHVDVAPLVERKAKIEAARPAPTPAKAADAELSQAPARPTNAPALAVELNPGERPEDLADALSIGRGLLAMQRRGMMVTINLGGAAS